MDSGFKEYLMNDIARWSKEQKEALLYFLFTCPETTLRIIEKNILSWAALYATVSGKTVYFTFDEDPREILKTYYAYFAKELSAITRKCRQGFCVTDWTIQHFLEAAGRLYIPRTCRRQEGRWLHNRFFDRPRYALHS